MATKQASFVHLDEEYIDMELSSSSNFFSHSICTSPQTREFEFQMTSVSNEKESTPSPADELFYEGKLLPLQLPPRLQMVQKLLENSNDTLDYMKTDSAIEKGRFSFTIDLRMPSTATSTSIPLESCCISPSESSKVSRELNPDEYRSNWSAGTNGCVGEFPKKSFSKKLKQIKQYWLGQKLKASRAYLKSVFFKSGCSDKSCAIAEKNSKCRDCRNKYTKLGRKNPFEIADDNKHQISGSNAFMKNINREMFEDGLISHRRSFSGAIQQHSATKSSSLSTSSSGSSSSSSSFSFSSSGFNDLHLFKRSSSANAEFEGSIEAAIAHCKHSQRQFSSAKSVNELALSSQDASEIVVCGSQKSQ